MTGGRGSTVVGVFEDLERAREAIEALKDDGFSGDSISILSPDRQATEDLAEETGTHAGSGAATGAVAGGILGGVGGWLVGIGALAIPGIGPFIAAGALAAAVGGAALGAGLGAIAGALVGMGVPEEHARFYEDEARAGKTLVTVRADGRYDEAQQILRDRGAYDVESRPNPRIATGEPLLKTPTDEPRPSGELRNEELVASKHTVETGQVNLGKEVVTRELPSSGEEVFLERRPIESQLAQPTERAP